MTGRDRGGGGNHIVGGGVQNRFWGGVFNPPLFFSDPWFLGADFWEGDATKHVSVKKGFSVKRGEAFSE